MTMPAGTYYIGDLCYVMTDDEWEDFCSITIKGNECLDGEFEMPDGRKFATYGTAWGDGQYRDQLGNSYGVDAGLIGCIRVEDIKKDCENLNRLGKVHKFETDFVTSGGRQLRKSEKWDGVIQFGRIHIETDPVYEDEYEEYE